MVELGKRLSHTQTAALLPRAGGAAEHKPMELVFNRKTKALMSAATSFAAEAKMPVGQSHRCAHRSPRRRPMPKEP